MAERKRGQPLDPKVKRRAAEIYGTGLSYSETAGACGISEKSVERIMQDPEYRRIAEEIKRKRTSMGAEVAELLRDLLSATDTDGNPDMRRRAEAAALYARNPEMFDQMDADEDGEAMLPAVILRFPMPSIPDPEAEVSFSKGDLAPAPEA